MKIIGKTLAFIFFIVSFITLCKVFFLGFYYDFSIYYNWEHWFNYPPVALVFFSMLPVIPYSIAPFIWTFFSIVSLFMAIYLVFKMYSYNLFTGLGFLVLGMACISFPVKFTLGMGQINNYVLLIFVAAIYYFNKNKLSVSMFLFALSVSIKLFPIYIFSYFIFTKKWKLMFTFFAFFLFFSICAILILGFQTNLIFFQKVLPTFLNDWKIDYYNQSLTGFVGRFLSDQYPIRDTIRNIISLFFLSTTFFVVFKTRLIQNLVYLQFSLLITLNLIINNFSWQHHFVFMVFPFLTTLFSIINNKLPKKYFIILFISYFLISFNIRNPSDFSVILTSHVFYGAVLMWVLQIFLIQGYIRPLKPNSPSGKLH